MGVLLDNNENNKKQLIAVQAAYRIASLLNKADGLDVAVEKTMIEFIDLVNADEGSIQLLRPSSQTTHYTLIRKGGKKVQLLDSQLNDIITGAVLKQKDAFIAQDLASLLELKNISKRYAGILSVLAAPILSGSETIGVVSLIRTRENDIFKPEDRQIISSLAGQIGEFLESTGIRERLFKENLRLQKNLRNQFSVYGIIGASPRFKEVYVLMEQVIPTDAGVMIIGESGTGKELIAKCIHYTGPRKDRPFVAVDCGALPANLLESELFGYVRGAFTGAIRDRRGLIEEAHTGTLFLDEITNMSIETQAKLLRFIQEEEIRPVGSNEIKKVNVRIIVAASCDLAEQLFPDRIRPDLYYRLNVVSIQVPPLRDRIEDIPELSAHFLNRFAKKHGKAVKKIASETMQILENYNWPGNIRELENLIERAVVMTHYKENTLIPSHLTKELTATKPPTPDMELSPENDLSVLMEGYERKVIEEVLNNNNWNQTAAARALNISEAVIRYKIKRLQLKKPDFTKNS